MTNIQFGDIYNANGTYSQIRITQATTGPRDQFQELVRAVELMQARVSGPDRQVVDDFLELASSPGDLERHRLRAALQQVAGVATMVGQVGVPVIEAIRQLKELLGL